MDHGLITFYELIPNPRPPMRATKSAGGTLPDRHHRCEPVRVASGFGWYVFLPLDLYILFDGMEAKWSFDEEQWFALDSICYPDAQSYPPFLVMTEDHGILQIWTGLVVKTEPDWSVLVRAPANYFQPTGYQMLEGVIETDHWTGPLFTNVRLLRTGSRIFFPANRPFAQIQPVPREVHNDRFLNTFQMKPPEELDWDAFNKTLSARAKPSEYAAAARRRSRDDPQPA
jgi:hypothetical protein